jgi:hypothetical protein
MVGVTILSLSPQEKSLSPWAEKVAHTKTFHLFRLWKKNKI